MPGFSRAVVLSLGLAAGIAAATGGCAPVGNPDLATSSGVTDPCPPPDPAPAGVRDVVLVGNNWSGTATIFDPATFEVLAVVDVAPDREERLAEIRRAGLKRRAALAFIREFVGEGNDQLVDDLFTSPDGRILYASRPSLADVVAIDLTTGVTVWHTPVEGARADHAALSPDGRTLLVSASTARKVHAIDTATGRIAGEFESGAEPHENVYADCGRRVYHASIGRVFLPELGWLDWLKGDRVFQIVDARTLKVLKRYDMRRETKRAGLEWEHAAVRPMAVSPDGRHLYFQMSYFHGFFEFDLLRERITRRVNLPIPDDLRALPRNEYVLNSAHHGITISGDGAKLCVAGTMAGYAAIVRRDTFQDPTIVPVGPKPYWATTSADGRHCYVSVSGQDRVAVIGFDEEREIGTVPVGRHPQRVRTGRFRVTKVPAPPLMAEGA